MIQNAQLFLYFHDFLMIFTYFKFQENPKSFPNIILGNLKMLDIEDFENVGKDVDRTNHRKIIGYPRKSSEITRKSQEKHRKSIGNIWFFCISFCTFWSVIN